MADLNFLLTSGSAPKRVSRWEWATVVSVAPLLIRLEGDTVPLAGSPRTLVNPANLAVGRRVRVELAPTTSGVQTIIHGPSGLEGAGLPDLVEQLQTDLDTTQAALTAAQDAIAALSPGPWLPIPAASGYTSTAEGRKVGTKLEFRGSFDKTSGNIASGDVLGTLPAALIPGKSGNGIGIGSGSSVAKLTLSAGNATIRVGSAPTATTTYLRIDQLTGWTQ